MPKKPTKPAPDGTDAMMAIPQTIGAAPNPNPEPEPEPDPPEFTEEHRTKLAAYDDLVKKSEAQDTQMARMQQTVDQLLATRLSGDGVGVAPVAVAPEPPDPMQDPEGFRKAVIAEATSAAAASIQPAQVAMTRENKLNDLKVRFKSAFPDLNDYEDLLDGEVIRRAKDAARRRMDPEAMMFTDPDAFVREVGTVVTARIEAIRGEKKDPNEEDEEDRAVGIPGGGLSKAPKGKAVPKPKGFIEQLKDMQRDVM